MKGLCTGILLTDLSKAFDCISHDFADCKVTCLRLFENLS